MANPFVAELLGGIARAAYGAPKMSKDFISGVSDEDLDLTPEGWVNKRTGTNYGMSKPNIEQPMENASFGRRVFSPDTAATMQQANQRYMMNPIESDQKTSMARDFISQQLGGIKNKNPDIARTAAVLLSGGQGVPERGAGDFNVPIQKGRELTLGVPDTNANTNADVATADQMQVKAALNALRDYGMDALTETQRNLLKAKGIISNTGVVNAQADAANASVNLMTSEGQELANRVAGGSEFYRQLTEDRLKALKNNTGLSVIESQGALDRGPSLQAAALANAKVAAMKAQADKAAADKFGISGFQLAQYNGYRQLGYDAESAAERARINKEIIPDLETQVKANSMMATYNALNPTASQNYKITPVDLRNRTIGRPTDNPLAAINVATPGSRDKSLPVPGLGNISKPIIVPNQIDRNPVAPFGSTNAPASSLVPPPAAAVPSSVPSSVPTVEPEVEPEVTRPPLTGKDKLAVLSAAAGLPPATTKAIIRAAKAGKDISGLLQTIFENVKRNTEQQ